MGASREAQVFLVQDVVDGLMLALEKGDAVAYFNFQKAAAGFKNVQELAKYMIERGLRFAPSVDGDDAAYTAMHTALATYDVAVNAQQIASTSKE